MERKLLEKTGVVALVVSVGAMVGLFVAVLPEPLFSGVENMERKLLEKTGVVALVVSVGAMVGLFVAVLPEPLFSGIENKGVVLE